MPFTKTSTNFQHDPYIHQPGPYPYVGLRYIPGMRFLYYIETPYHTAWLEYYDHKQRKDRR